mmetsp:Transcript_67622/g.187542  ORF Transcript_67622/g.187542 Transcript_67622/m.187542 type:complete len:134 (+) Transcript_67622:646-1047(+)
MAVQDKCHYTLLNHLLAPDRKTEHVVALPIGIYVQGEETLSYYDLHARVWQACGGVLLGWQREGSRYPDLNPQPKASCLEWRGNSRDVLLILGMEGARLSMEDSEALDIPQATLDSPVPPGCMSPTTCMTPEA